MKIRNKDEVKILKWLKENHPDLRKEKNSEQKLDSTDSQISWDESSIHAIDQFGNTSLHAACTRGAPVEIVQALLECLDDETINAVDWNDQTALHYACWSQASKSVIKLLLENLRVKTINVKDQDRENALHYAFAYDLSVEIICLIIQNAPNQAGVQNLNGKLPFELYNKEATDHKTHMEKLKKVHQQMDTNDQPYHPGLFKHLSRLSATDVSDFMNLSYVRRALNREIIRPFSLFCLIFETVIQIVVIGFFSVYLTVDDEVLPLAGSVVLACCFCELVLLPMIEISSKPLHVYLRDPNSIVDLLQIAVIGAVLFVYNIGTENYFFERRLLLVLAIGTSWFRFIFVSANLFYSLAVFVTALVTTINSLLPFAYVVAIVTASFAHMYHALGPPDNISCPDIGSAESYSEGGWVCKLPDSYFQSFVMTLGGEWAFFDQWEGLYSMVSLVFALIMGIILLNMLIALISDIFTRTKSQSELVFWMHRLRQVDQFESIRRLFCPSNATEGRFKEEEVPSRISLNDWWNENREDWKKRGEKYQQVLYWFCNTNTSTSLRDSMDNAMTPNFFLRITVFFEISTWGDIVSLSKAFRKFVAGVSYNEHLSGVGNLFAGIGAFLLLLAFGIKFIITLPLGLLTGGLFWEREIKEYLFFGEEDVIRRDSNNEINTLKAQIEYQKDQLDAIRNQNESILQHLLDLQAGTTTRNDIPKSSDAFKNRSKQLSSDSLTADFSC